MTKLNYLRQLEKELGLPFVCRKLTNSPRRSDKWFDHLPVSDDWGLWIFRRNDDNTYQAIDWWAGQKSGDTSPRIVHIIDTPAYGRGMTYSKRTANILYEVAVERMLTSEEDWLRGVHRKLAPLHMRDEYIRTRAYYLWLEGIGVDDLDRYYMAEEWICSEYLFVPKMKRHYVQ